MDSIMPSGTLDLIPLTDFTSGKIPDLKFSDSHIRRAVRRGDLPRRYDARHRLVFAEAEVREALCPASLTSTDEASLRAWARAKAAGAPPLHPKSLGLLVDTFAEALAQKVGVSSDV